MNFEQGSTNGLLMLHGAVRDALEADDNAPNNQKIYQVRQQAVWKHWADQIEAVLDGRGAKYTKIQW